MDSKIISWLNTILLVLILPALIGALLQETLTKVIVSPLASLFALSLLLPITYFLVDMVFENSIFSNVRIHIKLFFYYASFIIPYAFILYYVEEYKPGKISPFILIWYCVISSFFIGTFLPYIFRARIKEAHFSQLRISIPLAYLILTIIAIPIQPTYSSSIIILGAILMVEYIIHCILSISYRAQAMRP